MSESEPPIDVDVACDEERVEFSAPADRRYDVTVALVSVTAETTDVTRTSVGSVQGNSTVTLAGEGIVYTFVGNASDSSEARLTNVTDCTSAGYVANSTEEAGGADLEIDVDCTENRTRFVAPDETEYVAKLSVANVSATQTSTKSTTRTLRGTETVTIPEHGLVAAFASPGNLGDDRTVSTVRYCNSVEVDD